MDEPEIIERIAKALQKSTTGSEDGWANCVKEAYAAIRAMREPTDNMSVNGGLEIEEQMFAQQELVFDGAKTVFQRMVNVALAEPTQPR